MSKFNSLVLMLLVISGAVNADTVLNEELVKAISSEMTMAVKNNDFSIIEKYMHPESKIIIDMDPANNSGEKEIGYDEFMQLTKMSMAAMKNPEIDDELISIHVDKERNEATIVEKTTAIVEMLGMKMKDVSINKTTYGIINGEIKILSTEDQLISTGLIK